MWFKRVLAVTTLSILSFNSFALSEKDPFHKMSTHHLPNGMKVVLAPNNKANNIRIKHVVGFGSNAETDQNLQGGHVLEHMLFKDGNIGDNKSYLELIREAGGDVNAHVEGKVTAYYTTIPSEKGEWLIDKFKDMIFSRKLDEHELKLGKASVILEIGKPLLINRWLNANPIGFYQKHYFPQKDFWGHQFGIDDHPFDPEDERLAVNKLTLQKVQQIYEDYYYPSNMTLFIAGNFNSAKILKLLNKKFADINDTKGLKTPSYLAQFRGNNFIRKDTRGDGEISGITYGRTLFRRSAEEVLVSDIYFNYVAHRLMIELRNKKGETYTAHSNVFYEDDAGYATITFRTPSQVYETNKNYLVNLVQKEAGEGNFSDEDIKKAIDLFLKDRYEITDIDAETLMGLAEELDQFKADFGVKESPVNIITKLTPSKFREHLMAVHKEEKLYIWESLGPIVSQFDHIAVMLGGVMAGIMLFGFIWKNKKHIMQVKWGHASSYTPGLVLETALMIFMAVILNKVLWEPIDYFCFKNSIYDTSPFIGYYLAPFLGSITTTGIIMFLMKKFTVAVCSTGSELCVVQYISEQRFISYNEIKTVKVLNSIQKYNPKYWFSSKFSLNPFMDFMFWRKAVLITLHNGKSHLLFMKDAKALEAAINLDLNQNNNVDQEVKIAA